MKLERLLEIKKRIWEQCDHLTVIKGMGYGTDDDTLFNLRLVEYLGVSTAVEGAYVRMLDKVSRCARMLKLLKEGDKPPSEEGIKDTILDLINYAAYIYALLVERGVIRDDSDRLERT